MKEFEIKLQENMLNLMMYGEMSEWNKGAEEGDIINIDAALLKSCEDERVKQLLGLQEKIMWIIKSFG
jgi:hypothetical protein